MIVYQLTEQQKNELVGQFFAPASMFNPIQDENGIWIISSQEVEQCIVEEFMWIKNLPMIEYVPIINSFI
jgi:hypothetical protein